MLCSFFRLALLWLALERQSNIRAVVNMHLRENDSRRKREGTRKKDLDDRTLT
jgi:hypothetical protein